MSAYNDFGDFDFLPPIRPPDQQSPIVIPQISESEYSLDLDDVDPFDFTDLQFSIEDAVVGVGEALVDGHETKKNNQAIVEQKRIVLF